MIDFACKQFNLRDVIKCSLGLTKADLAIFEHYLAARATLGTDETAHALKFDQSTVQRAVKKLHEKKLLVRMQTNLDGGGYVYRYRVAERSVIRGVIMETIAVWRGRVETELKQWCGSH